MAAEAKELPVHSHQSHLDQRPMKCPPIGVTRTAASLKHTDHLKPIAESGGAKAAARHFRHLNVLWPAGQPAPALAVVPAPQRAPATSWQCTTSLMACAKKLPRCCCSGGTKAAAQSTRVMPPGQRAAWRAACTRIARLPEWQQVALCAAGVERSPAAHLRRPIAGARTPAS